MVLLVKEKGIEIAKRIEVGGPDEIDEDRLKEAVAPPLAPAGADKAESGGGGGSGGDGGVVKKGFARPKRPGK